MIEQHLHSFKSLSLAEMDSVKLMKRVDTKFILEEAKMPDILANLEKHYQILEIANNRWMTYDSTYFDTTNLDFYLSHHNGISNRVKIRVRNYVESELSFLEIKLKNNKGVTSKNRIKLSHYNTKLSQESKNFIKTTSQIAKPIHVTLINRFNRISLVNLGINERVTVDSNLSYNNLYQKEGLVIIELKQEKLNRKSPLFQVLKSMSVHPYSISKYCIGMATIHTELKQNNFKRKIQTIKKITA